MCFPALLTEHIKWEVTSKDLGGRSAHLCLTTATFDAFL